MSRERFTSKCILNSVISSWPRTMSHFWLRKLTLSLPLYIHYPTQWQKDMNITIVQTQQTCWYTTTLPEKQQNAP